MNVQEYIIQQFFNDIQKRGFFWRINRPDTFIDLLMLQGGKASGKGINYNLAMEVILIALKALINGNLGLKDYMMDHNVLKGEITKEIDIIIAEAERIIIPISIKAENIDINHSLSEDLNYFKILNNLDLTNYSSEVFENVLCNFLNYIKFKS